MKSAGEQLVEVSAEATRAKELLTGNETALRKLDE